MLGVLRQFTIPSSFYREIRAMRDGGCVALDWFRDSHVPGKTSPRAPVLLVLHGITGGSSEGYVKWVCDAADERRWRAVVMNYRGCAGLSLTSPQPYNAVFTDDVHEVVQCIRGKFPGAPIFAVGYSLGALILTKYVAEADSGAYASGDLSAVAHAAASNSSNTAARPTPIDEATRTACGASGVSPPSPTATIPGEGSGLCGVALVSNPVCMTRAGVKIGQPWTMGWIYNLVITHRLKAYMRQHRHQLEHLPDFCLSSIAECYTLRQFDGAATIRTAGFPSTEAYYEAGSSQNFIPRIRTPSLFLLAEDDPFLGYLPIKECRENEFTVLAATSHGGHCAHLRGLWPLNRSWADGAVVEFFEALRPAEGGPGAAAGARATVSPQPHSSLQRGFGSA